MNQLSHQEVEILHLRPGYFYTNLLHTIGLIKSGGFIGMNYAEDTTLVLVHPNDISAVAAETLMEQEATTGNNFRYISSDQATLTEITKALGNAIGKPELPYVQFSDETALNGYLQMGLNEGMAASLVEIGKATRDGRMIAGYLANPPSELGAIKLAEFAEEFALIYSA